MGKSVEDLLRLALRADGEGRPGTRDALLTLAVAESFVDDPEFSERCRAVLIARQPDHWFATSSTHALALGQSRVVSGLAKLRAIFPPVRVERLLLRAEAQHGPFTGRSLPIAYVLDALAGKAEPARPEPRRRRKDSFPQSLPFPVPGATRVHEDEGVEIDGSLVALYWSVLLAMAVLLNTVIETSSRDSRAA